MRCIRVHRARRSARAAQLACGLGVGLLLTSPAQRVLAQQPVYPPAPYPTYPTAPPYPQYPTYPQYPQAPQVPHYPQLPQPGLPGQPAPSPQPYRIPLLSLAQPTEGVVLPDDKPVAVFRFAASEAADPVDALSFSVVVDGIDRTALFTLANGEAWGPLAPADQPLLPGQHEVRARICSARGTCGIAKGTVTIVSSESQMQAAVAAGSGAGNGSGSAAARRQRRVRVLSAVLQAARVLIQ
jgi:hypothetical protein